VQRAANAGKKPVPLGVLGTLGKLKKSRTQKGWQGIGVAEQSILKRAAGLLGVKDGRRGMIKKYVGEDRVNLSNVVKRTSREVKPNFCHTLLVPDQYLGNAGRRFLIRRRGSKAKKKEVRDGVTH